MKKRKEKKQTNLGFEPVFLKNVKFVNNNEVRVREKKMISKKKGLRIELVLWKYVKCVSEEEL